MLATYTLELKNMSSLLAAYYALNPGVDRVCFQILEIPVAVYSASLAAK